MPNLSIEDVPEALAEKRRQRLDCALLLTEDLTPGQSYGRLQALNPFLLV